MRTVNKLEDLEGRSEYQVQNSKIQYIADWLMLNITHTKYIFQSIKLSEEKTIKVQGILLKIYK